MAYPARFLIAALFALALSAGPGWAMEEPSPLAPPEPPVVVDIPVGVDIPPAPLGLSPTGHIYSLLSNSQWEGAKQVKRLQTANPNASDANSRQNYGFIWDTTCLPNAQKVTFHRRYYLPGPPKNFAARLWTTKTYAIKDVKIYINGNLAFVKTNLPEFIVDVIPLTEDRYPKLFKNGMNDIRIEATKFADNVASSQLCKFGPMGIAFELYGEFSADLVGSRNPGLREIARQISETDPLSFTIPIQNLPFLKNLGPSAVYRAQFGTSVSASGFQVFTTELIPLANSQTDCTLDSNKHSMFCEFTKWSPSTVKTFPSGVLVNLRAFSGHVDSFAEVRFGVGSPTVDPNSTNNSATLRVWICFPGSPNPKCLLPAS
jgi:hypothetical protein